MSLFDTFSLFGTFYLFKHTYHEILLHYIDDVIRSFYEFVITFLHTMEMLLVHNLSYHVAGSDAVSRSENRKWCSKLEVTQLTRVHTESNTKLGQVVRHLRQNRHGSYRYFDRPHTGRFDTLAPPPPSYHRPTRVSDKKSKYIVANYNHFLR